MAAMEPRSVSDGAARPGRGERRGELERKERGVGAERAWRPVSRRDSSRRVSPADERRGNREEKGGDAAHVASPCREGGKNGESDSEVPETQAVSEEAPSALNPLAHVDPRKIQPSSLRVQNRPGGGVSTEKSRTSARFFAGLAVAMVLCVVACLYLLREKPNNPLGLLTHAPFEVAWVSRALASFFSLSVSLGGSPTVSSLSSLSAFGRDRHVAASEGQAFEPSLLGNLSDAAVSLPFSADVDAATGVDADFLDSLSPWEVREFLLADGWSETPNHRSAPLVLPDILPRLPRAGGGEHLRRHHHLIDGAASPSLPVTAEVALERGRQLLTANVYEEARLVLDQAVREGHLTRAVRMHGQFLYPWKLFSDAEREVLRLTADQVRWFPKWVKNHRNSQRVERSVLDAFLPVLPPQFTDRYGGPGSPEENRTPGIRFTWLGHASGLVNVDGLKILIDPMFDADLIGPYSEWLRSVMKYISSLCGSLGERHRKPPCEYDGLPSDVDVVLLSHNHPDHIMEHDAHAICTQYAKKFRRALWYVPEGVTGFLRQQGCLPSSVFEFSWGESRTLSCHARHGRRVCSDGVWHKRHAKAETFKFTFTAGVHWSGRSPSKIDHNASLWGGFAVAGPKHKFFYGGDTAYWRPDFDEYRKIGQVLGPFHLAALPIGAYEPNADLRYQHVKPWETVQMFHDVRAETAVGVHWGTLRLSAEEFFDPMLDLECALLNVNEEDCKKTTELQHRYVAAHALLTHLPKGVDAASSSPAKESEASGTAAQGTSDWDVLERPASSGSADKYRSRRRSPSFGDDNVEAVPSANLNTGPAFAWDAERSQAVGEASRHKNWTEMFFSHSMDDLMKDEMGRSGRDSRGRYGASDGKSEGNGPYTAFPDDLSLSPSQFDSMASSESGAVDGMHAKKRKEVKFQGKGAREKNGVSDTNGEANNYGIEERVALAGGLPPLPEQAKLVADLLMKLENMMVAQAHPYRHASNIQRLLRSLKLQDAGVLADDDAWKEQLLTDGARFQTLFVGQSLQVEEAEGSDYLLMTRSSGLQHVWPEAPNESYTFTFKHFERGGARKQRRRDKDPGDIFPSVYSWRDGQTPEDGFPSLSSEEPGLFI